MSKNKNISVGLLLVILFNTNSFASWMAKKFLFAIPVSSTFAGLTLFFLAKHRALTGSYRSHPPKNNFIDLISQSNTIENNLSDDFFSLLPNDRSLQEEFLRIPIMLYSNQVLNTKKLQEIVDFLATSVPYLSDDIVSKIFKRVCHYNYMFMDNSSKIAFADHLALLEILLKQGIKVNEAVQHDSGFTFHRTGVTGEEILEATKLFLKHGLFIKKNVVDALSDESLKTVFQSSINNEFYTFKYLDNQIGAKSGNKELALLCNGLVQSTRRPLMWLSYFMAQYEIPFEKSIDIFAKTMVTVLDQRENKTDEPFHIKDLQFIFDYMAKSIENISSESKVIVSSKMSDMLGTICNKIISFGYYQDESNYLYFRPLLVYFITHSNKNCKPNLSIKDAEGTTLQKLARHVFDEKIIDLMSTHYDALVFKSALLEKKEHNSFKSEFVTCFDIAKLSEDDQTREIFDNLSKAIL